jgi:hypothetical protein
MWEFVLKYWVEFVFGVIVAGLSGAYARLSKKFKAERAKNQAIENGLRGILRIQILDTYDRCLADGKKISVSRKDAITSIYQSYIALGDGNHPDDTIKGIYNEISNMEIK